MLKREANTGVSNWTQRTDKRGRLAPNHAPLQQSTKLSACECVIQKALREDGSSVWAFLRSDSVFSLLKESCPSFGYARLHQHLQPRSDVGIGPSGLQCWCPPLLQSEGRTTSTGKAESQWKISHLIFKSRGGNEQFWLNPGMWDLSERAAARCAACDSRG